MVNLQNRKEILKIFNFYFKKKKPLTLYDDRTVSKTVITWKDGQEYHKTNLNDGHDGHKINLNDGHNGHKN